MSAGLNVYCLDGSGRDVMALPGTLERRVARRRSSTMDELGPKIQTFATTRVAVLHDGEVLLAKQNGNRDSEEIRGVT